MSVRRRIFRKHLILTGLFFHCKCLHEAYWKKTLNCKKHFKMTKFLLHILDQIRKSLFFKWSKNRNAYLLSSLEIYLYCTCFYTGTKDIFFLPKLTPPPPPPPPPPNQKRLRTLAITLFLRTIDVSKPIFPLF